MPIDFPASPTTNQTYTFGTKTWVWSGSAWKLSTTGNVAQTNIDQTFTGTQTLIPSAAGNVPLMLKGAASQSADLLSVQNSAGTVYVKVASFGSLQTNAGLYTTFIGSTADGVTSATFSGNKNIQLGGGSTSTGGGSGTIGISNATTVPTFNPTGGGVLYVDTGALKYRGTSGTAATIVNADGTGGGGSGVSLTPSATQTIVAQNATTTPLVVKSAAAPSVNLFDIQNSAGTSHLKVSSSGQVIAPLIQATTTAVVGGNVTGSTNVALQVKGNDDGTGFGANIMEIYDSTGALKVSIGSSGYWNGGVSAGTEFVSGATIAASDKLQGNWLQLGAGTTTQVPILLQAGTNRTTPLSGAIEFNGTNLFFTPSTTRRTFAFLDSPAFTTPSLGAATATSINGTTIPSSATLYYSTSTVSSGTTTTASSGIGYMGLPQNAATTGAYTVVAADAGKHIYASATRTVTIDSNANLALPIGTTLTFIAGTGATMTIAITTDTMYLAGAGTTGSRTLAAFGMATAVKITATSWMISGNGLS